jgi:hypothetical protein
MHTEGKFLLSVSRLRVKFNFVFEIFSLETPQVGCDVLVEFFGTSFFVSFSLTYHEDVLCVLS